MSSISAGTTSTTTLVHSGDTTGSLVFKTNDTGSGGTTAVTIDTSQNVLVGTTTTTNNIRLNQKLAVVTTGSSVYGGFSNTSYNGTSAGVGPIADFQRSRGTTDGSMTAVASGDTLGYMVFRGSDGTSFQDSSYITGQVDGSVGAGTVPGRLVFNTSNAERMRIDSSGNLFVGTTSNFSADKMCLNFTSGINGLGIRDDSNTSGAYYAVFRNSANQVIGSITRVTTTNAVAYNTTSDQRLKSNIADASPVLNKLMNVKVRQFDWTEGNLHQDAGFIAQELSTVLSGIVTEGRTEDDLWQLDYARLTPYLTKAIQELKAINDQQAETINALTARVVALESK